MSHDGPTTPILQAAIMISKFTSSYGSHRKLIAFFAILFILGAQAQAQVDEEKLDQFLNAVQIGETEGLLNLMHPKLAEQIDPPILEAWLQSVAYKLGSVEVVLPATSIIAGDREEFTSNVSFTKGTARVAITVLNDSIVAFEVQSDELANWFQRPTSLKIYRDRVERFMTALDNQEYDRCLSLMHSQIAEKLNAEILSEYLEKVEQVVGASRTRKFQFAKLTILPDERLEQIDLYYEIEGSLGSVTAEFAIRFQGMRGQLVGFRFR